MTTPTTSASTPFLLGRFVSITNGPAPDAPAEVVEPERTPANDVTIELPAEGADVTRMLHVSDLLAVRASFVPTGAPTRQPSLAAPDVPPVVPSPTRRSRRLRLALAIGAAVVVAVATLAAVVAALSARESASASETTPAAGAPRPGTLGRLIPADVPTEPSTTVTTAAPARTTPPGPPITTPVKVIVVREPAPARRVTVPAVPPTVPPTVNPTVPPTIPPGVPPMATIPPTTEPPDSVPYGPGHPDFVEPCGPDAPPEC